ncbi:DUF968 domain-containing protein [Chromohalobacter salexigens]|nr:DUF968 domain-containing protein [Chromohalobacter salexigens]
MKRTALQRKTPLKNRNSMARKPMDRRPKRRARRQEGSDGRWRSEAYLAWVRRQPCVCCAGPGGDAHHVIGLHWGLSGMGTTAPDSYAMPVCRACHQDIHRLPDLQRCQPKWLRHTIALGMREFGGEVGEALVEAERFIDEKERAA